MSIESICGSLLIGGFRGTSLPADYEKLLRSGRRGGAILFKANAIDGSAQLASLARQVHAALPAPLLGVDQEGGRVARLGAPFLKVPPMRAIGRRNDPALAEAIARALGMELAAVGVTVNFAPVLDVDTCALNPVIGDRSFGSDPALCARLGVAWIRGLESAGLLATGKHFPGHGDTSTDSHFELPVVRHSVTRLQDVEWVPFRAAIAHGVAALMTAHVVYPSIDAELPATLSAAVCTRLRRELGFDGMLVSDDLEMRAVADSWPAGDAAVRAVAAGCDAILVCHDERAQDGALAALVREAESSPAFAARCAEAHARVMKARERIRVGPPERDGLARAVESAESTRVAAQLARLNGPEDPNPQRAG
jgi:beta-N-acetylhexosaminidase